MKRSATNHRICSPEGQWPKPIHLRHPSSRLILRRCSYQLLLLAAIALTSAGQDSCDPACDDSDADGICNEEDICPAGNDLEDQDGDGVPDACGGFVRVSGAQFLVNDQPFYFVGTNNYTLMTWAAEPDLRSDVDEVLEETARMGMSVVRLWPFNDGDGWNAVQLEPGVYDDRVLEGLDYVLARAATLGLRVILPLVNNWDDYGGMYQYVAWSPTAEAHDDFYTDTYTREWYADFAAMLVHRVNSVNGRTFRDDPAIFAWELANEPRCQSDSSGDTLVAWIDEMSAYLKSIDPNHMLSTGSEGFYDQESGPWVLDGSQGVDFLRDHDLPNVDFATSHLYPDGWNVEDAVTLALLDQQIADARDILGKPLVLEEFGKLRDADSSTQARDRYFSECLDRLYRNAAGGALFWALYHDSYPDYDGYGVYYPADESTAEIILDYAGKMNGVVGYRGASPNHPRAPQTMRLRRIDRKRELQTDR